MKTRILLSAVLISIAIAAQAPAQNNEALPGNAGLDPAASSKAAAAAAQAADALTHVATEMDPAVDSYNTLLGQMDANADQYTVFYLKQKALDDQAATLIREGHRDDAIKVTQQRDSARASAKMWLDMIPGPAAEATRMYASFQKTPLFDKVYHPTGYTRARSLLQGRPGVNPNLQYLGHLDASAQTLQNQLTDVQSQIRQATARKDDEIAQLQADQQRSDKLTADLRDQIGEAAFAQSLMKQQIAAALKQPASRSALLAPLASVVNDYNTLLHKIETDQAADLTPHVSDDAQKAVRLHDVIVANPLFAAAFHETTTANITGQDPPLHYIARK
ncbi:MAG: hypothetical protein LC772_03380 [Chloroflexi bacterium]|nr:hypothetical protein [Chloroflexota bacterium]